MFEVWAACPNLGHATLVQVTLLNVIFYLSVQLIKNLIVKFYFKNHYIKV